MKKINTCMVLFMISGVIITVLSLRIVIISLKNSTSNSQNFHNIREIESSELLNYIYEIDDVLLCVYERNFVNKKLSQEQKIFIAQMYIRYYKGQFLDKILCDDNGNEYVQGETFKVVYEKIFGKDYWANVDDIKLLDFNADSGHLDEVNFEKYEIIEENKYSVQIEYISKFEQQEFPFKVKYYICKKENSYCLIGFEMIE